MAHSHIQTASWTPLQWLNRFLILGATPVTAPLETADFLRDADELRCRLIELAEELQKLTAELRAYVAERADKTLVKAA